ncbi:tail fiber domain-containing protein [Bacteroidota bacterium]
MVRKASNLFIVLILLLLAGNITFGQNVVVTDEDSYEVDSTAMLDVYSESKGLLIPRLTSSQRTGIEGVATGLLVYDSDLNVFYYHNGSGWINISKGQIWEVNSNYVYLTSETRNVGIGTSTPNSKLEVRADDSFTADDTLFVVKDKNGNAVFAVFPDGVKVIVEENSKGKVGGFAISGRSPNKAGEETDIMIVTPDSTRVFVNDTIGVKGKVGGFAISGRSPNKGIKNEYFLVTGDSTRVYINDTAITKGKVGGFAISGRSPNKGVSKKFMDMTKDNYFIGHESGQSITDVGLYNSTMGYQSGMNLSDGESNAFIGYQSGYGTNIGDGNLFIGYQSGYTNQGGDYNSFLGYQSGFSNSTGVNNSFIGSYSGYSNTSGSYNTFAGDSAGYNNSTGNENSFYGDKAGYSNTYGSNNVFVGNLAGYLNTGADSCIFIGNRSGFSNTGTSNIFIGNRSGYSNTTGEYNTFLGYRSGYYNTEGNNNVFFGYQAGNNNSIGHHNVSIGYSSGSRNEEGAYNVSIGALAGSSNTQSTNVFLGGLSGSTNVSGASNIFIGYMSGYTETGSDKLYIESSSANKYNALIYGEFNTDILKLNADVTVKNGLTIGNSWNISIPEAGNDIRFSRNFLNYITASDALGRLSFRTGGDNIRMTIHSNGNVGIGVTIAGYLLEVNGTAAKPGGGTWTNSSDIRLKDIHGNYEKGLDEVLKLNPILFNYKVNNSRELPSQEEYIGFIAQDVQKIFPEAISKGKDGYLDFNMHAVNVALVNAVKDQQKIIEELRKENHEVKNRLTEIEKLLQKN